MRITQTTLTVTEPEKKESYWREKTKSAQWSQICAGVICVVGFLLIFAFTLSLAVEPKAPLVRFRKPNNFSFPRILRNDDPKCESDLIIDRLVICTDIMVSDNISELVLEVFKTFNNEGGLRYIFLKIEGMLVPDGILVENWIQSSDYDIKKLHITANNIQNIENGAFNGRVFRHTDMLTLERLTIKSLGSKFFTGLVSLNELNFRECQIEEFQENALELLQNKLEVLQIQNMKHPWNPINLTGTTEMNNLVTVDFRFNNVFSEVFNFTTFTGLKKCIQIFFSNSILSEIGEQAFVPMESLTKIDLANNSLTHLSETTMNRNMNEILIDGNKWNCSCELEWLKNLHLQGIVKGNPRCYPSRKTFKETQFCNEDIITPTPSTQSSTEIDTSTFAGDTTSTTKNNAIHLNCSDYRSSFRTGRKLLSEDRYWHIANSTIDFEIEDFGKPGSIVIKVTPPEEGNVALLWFPIDYTDSLHIPCVELSFSRSNQQKISLEGLNPGKSYTFCFVERNEEKIPPLNCKSHMIRKLYEDEAWILNRHKELIIGLSCFGLLLLCVVSALMMYATVRKYPSLMQGSKRVVMVKRKNVEAIVLPPKFNDIQEIPTVRLPPAELRRNRFRRSVSETSVVSGSYVSAIEPTTTQLLAFRYNRLRNKLGNDKIINENDCISPESSPPAPRLPPRPGLPVDNWDCASFSEMSVT